MSEFDEALRGAEFPPAMMQALEDADGCVFFAKKILLSNRVQQFSASDVVRLSVAIMDREADIRERSAE